MIAQGLVCVLIFIVNILVSRRLTVMLIENDFIKRDGPEFRKAMLFWFVPVMGALGLWFLFLTKKFILLWHQFFRWTILHHHKTKPISCNTFYDENEILKRVELIKEKERLSIQAAKTKKPKTNKLVKKWKL
jgi:hypothetical protein